MKPNEMLRLETYQPAALLDALLQRLSLKNDAALAKCLDMMSPTISRIRHKRQPISAGILLRMHDVSLMPIAQLRAIGGIPRLIEDAVPDVQE